MTFQLPGYTVVELFPQVTTISLSAMRYALHNHTTIWVL